MNFRGVKSEAHSPTRWATLHQGQHHDSAVLTMGEVPRVRIRFSGFVRNLGFGYWTYALHVVLLATPFLDAASNDAGLDDPIPPLQPPKPELLPGFWEQHGFSMGIAAAAAVLLGLILWKVLRRSEPKPPPSAADIARAALYDLQGHDVNVTLHDRVSSILRTYFVSALHLPNSALTNQELCGAVGSAGPKASDKARALLLALDRHRFDPGPYTTLTNAVPEALRVIEMSEAHLHPPTDEGPSTADAKS